MSTELTHTWVNKVLGALSFSSSLSRMGLLWMSYRRYEIKLLHSKNNDVSIVTGGSNKCIQTPDVSWNKPFKVMARQEYDKWLAEEAINQPTSAGRLISSPRRTAVNWILEVWKEMIPESLSSLALNLAEDDSEDVLIHCFKKEVSLAKLEKNSGKPIVNPDRKRCKLKLMKAILRKLHQIFSWLIQFMVVTSNIKLMF